MPTLSFKDRGAATLVAHMKAIGVTSCVQDSSGNAGNSVAAYAARAGIACEIYVPEGTSPKKITMIESHGAKVHVVPSTRDHCADVCRKQVAERGAYYANHVYNPYFYEGMKAYIYEIFEQLGRMPANIVIPVGNGTLFIGLSRRWNIWLHRVPLINSRTSLRFRVKNAIHSIRHVCKGWINPPLCPPRPQWLKGLRLAYPCAEKKS